MASSALLAIDLGTSTIKVVAFDPAGRVLAMAKGDTPTTRLADGRAEHDLDALWALCLDLIAGLTASLGDTAIDAVAVASVGEAGAALDRACRPVRPAIAWFDSRGASEAAWWEREAGLERVGRLTGQAIDAHFTVNRLLWIRQHEPEAYARTAHWMSLADFVIERLSGVVVTDYTLASRSMLFDQERLAWSPELLGLAGLDPSLFPDAVPSGTKVGDIKPEVARATRLREGTPVVTAGHDRLCAAFAARGVDDIAIDSTGSAEAVVISVPRYEPRSPVESGFVSHYADVVPGRYVLSARVGYAGALVDWYRRQLRASDAAADRMSVDAEVGWPLSFSGLLCYPSFGRVVAPEWDPATSTGALLGLKVGQRGPEIVQALIEGVAYSLRANLECLETLTGAAIPSIRVEGPLTGSRVWMQLKADVTGRVVEGLRLAEATALGAALLGGVGAGVFADCSAAAAVVRRDIEPWTPEAMLSAVYADVFERGFRRLPRIIEELAPLLEWPRPIEDGPEERPA